MISYKQFVTSNATLELFLYEDNYVTKTANKIGLTFQLARAAFNLLDTGKEGCVNVRKLRQNEQIMGELGYGEELFNCFGGLETLYPADMVLVLARWVGVVDEEPEDETGERKGLLGDEIDDGMSMGGGRDSDINSTSTNMDRGGDEEGEVDSRAKSEGKRGSFVSRLVAKWRGGTSSIKLEDELLKRLSVDYADNIEGIFSAYDVDNSGSIDKEEFAEMVRHLFGAKSFTQTDIDRSFSFFDIDKTEELLKHVFQMTLLDYRDIMEAGSTMTNAAVSKDADASKKSEHKGLILDAENSTVVKLSNSMMTVAAFYYFLMVPYEICFIHNSPRGASSDTRVIGWGVDCILYFDMFVKFHTTYVNHRR